MKTRRELAFAIMKAVRAEGRSVHRRNLLGGGLQPGTIEQTLGASLDAADRQTAYGVFEELVRNGLLWQPRTDITSPDEWVKITDAGVASLERGTFDQLDEALHALAPRFVLMREGMWTTAFGNSADRNRQAAHSARELIDQVLKEHGQGSNRRERIRSLMDNLDRTSKKHQIVTEKMIELVMAVFDQVIAEAHSRSDETDRDIIYALEQTEAALSHLLIRSVGLAFLFEDGSESAQS